MFRYSTDTEAKHAIRSAIEAGFTVEADGYDVDAIFAEAYEWRIDTDEAGNQLLNTGGFEQIVDEDGFWQIVEKHEPEAPAQPEAAPAGYTGRHRN